MRTTSSKEPKTMMTMAYSGNGSVYTQTQRGDIHEDGMRLPLWLDLKTVTYANKSHQKW